MTALDHSNDETYSKALYNTLSPESVVSEALIDFNIWIIFLIYHYKIVGDRVNTHMTHLQ